VNAVGVDGRLKVPWNQAQIRIVCQYHRAEVRFVPKERCAEDEALSWLDALRSECDGLLKILEDEKSAPPPVSVAHIEAMDAAFEAEEERCRNSWEVILEEVGIMSQNCRDGYHNNVGRPEHKHYPPEFNRCSNCGCSCHEDWVWQ
jgi:hypothetical protein